MILLNLYSIAFAYNSYTLNFKSSLTYMTSCGTVNPAQWEVKDDSCLLYTPFFFPVEGDGDSLNVTFSIRINQSGNLSSTDNAYIFVQLNSGSWRLLTCYDGAGEAAVFTYASSMNVSRTDDFRFIIAMENTNKTNFWQIKDGDIHVENVIVSDPMPVELMNFTGQPQNEFVLLQWVTASETNNDYFSIERSEDGFNYYPVADISGAGNSNEEIGYHYSDVVNSLGNSHIYYRLKQTDFNGKSETIGSVVCAPEVENAFGSMIISYSASNKSIGISFTSDKDQSGHVNLYGISGSLISTTDFELSEGNNLILSRMNDLNSGVYIISLTVGEEAYNEKIILF